MSPIKVQYVFFRIWQLGLLGLRMGRVGTCSTGSGAFYDSRIGQVACSYLTRGRDLKNGLRNYYFLGSRIQWAFREAGAGGG